MKNNSVQSLLLRWAENHDESALQDAILMLMPELNKSVYAFFSRHSLELREDVLSKLKTDLIIECRSSKYYASAVPRLLAPPSHTSPIRYRKFVLNAACITEVRALSTARHKQKAFIAGVLCRTRSDNRSYRDVINAHREGRFNELLVRDNGGRPLVNEAALVEDPFGAILHSQYGDILLSSDSINLRRKVVLCLECDIDVTPLASGLAKLRNLPEETVLDTMRYAALTGDKMARISVLYDEVNERSIDAYRTLRNNAIRQAKSLFSQEEG